MWSDDNNRLSPPLVRLSAWRQTLSLLFLSNHFVFSHFLSLSTVILCLSLSDMQAVTAWHCAHTLSMCLLPFISAVALNPIKHHQTQRTDKMFYSYPLFSENNVHPAHPVQPVCRFQHEFHTNIKT